MKATLAPNKFAGQPNANSFHERPRKTSVITLSLAALALLPSYGTTRAQISGTTATPPKAQVAAMGMHWRKWTSVTSTNSGSQAIAITNNYLEIGTGMNVFENGHWGEAKADIVPGTADGAVADQAQHTAYFPGDLYSESFELTTPLGAKLAMRPLGLAFADDQQTTLIAELKPGSNATLYASQNQILYSDICDSVRLDLLVSNRRASYENDLVIREQLPSPSQYGFPDPSTVKVQWWTEFLEGPDPVGQSDAATGDEPVLQFPGMKMPQGRAFLLQGSSGPEMSEIPVRKEYAVINGRKFLIEEIPFTVLQSRLQNLPQRQAAVVPRGKLLRSLKQQVSFPAPRMAKRGSKPVQIARNSYRPGSAFVWDYALLNSTQTNFVFQGDTTYYLSSDVVLSGTNSTFEGNAVLKYATGVSLNVGTPVTWLAGAYHPVVMAAADDDTVGEVLDISNGNPGTNYYAAAALFFDAISANSSIVLRNLRIANAQTAVVLNGKAGHILSHLQLQNCGNGFVLTNAEVSVRNALFDHVMTNFAGVTSTGRVEHLTADTAMWLNGGIGANLFLTNSLLVGVTNTGTYTAQNVNTAPAAAGVFLTVGGGAHYLVDGSTNRDAGTLNINPSLAADFNNMTTYPPLVFSNATISSDTILGRVAQRDFDTPDIGAHYDALDYVFGGTVANANVTFAPGTAVGWFRTTSGWENAGYGLHLADRMTATFNGQVDLPDYWVRANVVQEGGTGNWDGGYGPGGIDGSAWPDIADSAQIVARFTRFSTLANDWSHYRDDYGWLIANATHCEYYGGSIGFYNGGHHYTNCLFDRTIMGFSTDHHESSFSMRNCTVRGGLASPTRFNDGTGATAVIRECAFDGTSVSTSGAGPGATYYDYNAFLTNADRTTPNGSNDEIVTNFNWVAGPLGNFYLPTNSVLINHGGVTADTIGLYHFTTTTNLVGGVEVKETNSVVDISAHYVAAGGAGKPIDSDSDSISDYIEDTNGNGTVDSGETDWQNATELGLKVVITHPRAGATFP